MLWGLGAYSAQYRVLSDTEGCDFGDWLNLTIELGYRPEDRLGRAFRAAKLLCQDDKKAWQMFWLKASWADEAMSHPKLWCVTEALAERLLAVKRRMPGEQAVQIIEDAWGKAPKLGLPFLEMGSQWRSRFLPLVPPPSRRSTECSPACR